jgi:hypothetical protein
MPRRTRRALTLAVLLLSGAAFAPAAVAAPRPITAAFYYTWYPETWKPVPHARPTLGHYRSTDRSLILAHLRLLRQAHVDAAIVSWWGASHSSDSRLKRMMAVARRVRSPVKFAIYHEGEGQGDPSVASLQKDIAHVLKLARSPRYLRVGNKPVIFAFSQAHDGCGMVNRWRQAARGRVYFVLKVFPGYTKCASQPSSWHQYAPVLAQVTVPGKSISISPGFFHAGNPTARLGRDERRFRASVRAMNASPVRWHLITTFNEWGEGTAVEPSTSWRRGYIDALAQRGQQPLGIDSLTVAASGGTATVTTGIGTGARGRTVYARVEWGKSSSYTSRSAWRVVRYAAGPRELRFQITGVEADSRLHVRVVVRRGSLTRASADRAVNLGSVHIAAAGDISCGGASSGASCQSPQTAGVINAGRYAAVLALGDLQYEKGALSDFQKFYDATWGAFKAITYPAVGNHEYLTGGAAGYYAYFGARAGDPAKGYYSYNVGSWHLISINSNCSKAGAGGCAASSAQATWLRADLAANRSACTIAYWHHPRFSSGDHGDQTQVKPLWDALAAANADVVLSGHDHHYERFAPIDGIRSFVVGTGGRNLTGFGTPKPGSEVRLQSFGILDLELRDGDYTWRFKGAPGGAVLDSGTALCH